MPVDPTSTFYEDDEPVEEIEAAWEGGVKGRTGRPRDFNERAVGIVDEATAKMAFEAMTVISAEELDSIVISGSTFTERLLRIPTNPTGIKIIGNRFVWPE